MKKYLVTIEFRYEGMPDKHGCTWKRKVVTVGVYDTLSEACEHGNVLLETLESKFPLNVFANGTTAKRERFSENGGCFGLKNTSVANLGYLKTPFEFYAQITTLDHVPAHEAISDVVADIQEYSALKKSEKQ